MPMETEKHLTILLLATERTLKRARGQMGLVQFQAFFGELTEALNTIKGFQKLSLEDAFELVDTHNITLPDDRKVISIERRTKALFYVKVEGDMQVHLQRWDFVYVYPKDKESKGEVEPDQQPTPVVTGDKSKGG